MNRRRIALGVGANAIDKVVAAAIQILLVPVLASHWGLARYGGWAMLTTVPGILALSDLGFANAATVRMTMQVARGELAAARITIRSATQVVGLACALIVTVVSAFALLAPAGIILDAPETTDAEMRQAFICLAVYSALIMGCGLLQGIFRSNGRFATGTALSTLTALMENGLLVSVVLLGEGLAAGAAALMLGRLTGFLTMFGVAASMRTGLLPAFSGGSPAVRRELLGPALAAMAIPLASALLLQGTVAALGFVAGTLVVPAFVAARTLSRIGLQGSQMLTTALMPEFGAATAKGDHRSVMRMFVLVLGSATAIAVPFALLLAFAGPWIVLQWSNQHIHASEGLMLAVAVSALCGGIWNPLSNLMLAINRQSEFAIAYAVLAALAVALTLSLSRTLGSTAPGIAMAMVDIAMLVVVARFALRHWISQGSLKQTAAELSQEARADLQRITGRSKPD